MSQRHSFERQARHSPTSSPFQPAPLFRMRSPPANVAAPPCASMDRVLPPRPRQWIVQDVELVRRANGDRTLCERVEKIRVVVKLEVASRCDHESHAWDQWIAERHVIHDVGPVRNERDVVGVPKFARRQSVVPCSPRRRPVVAGAAPSQTEARPMNPPLVKRLPVDRWSELPLPGPC